MNINYLKHKIQQDNLLELVILIKKNPIIIISKKINLDSNIASNSYYIEFYSYGTSNNKLSNLDIEILALGTENSATKGLFNNYPLETTNP